MMVEFSGMSDKESQQRRGRADGAVWSVADRIAVEENRALAPETAQESPWWPPVDRQPRCPGRDSVDSAERCALAGLVRGVSASLDLLATAAVLGGAGPLAESLARISGRTQRTKTVAVERVFFGREFCSRQKRGAGVGKTKRGKGTKWMVVVDGRGLPLGDYLHSASPAEVRLAETTLATIRVGRRHRAGRPRQKPVRVIADKAYDSDPLRERLARRGIELIAERTNAWLVNFRRLVVRYDRSLMIYRAFFHIACFMIVLRRVVQ